MNWWQYLLLVNIYLVLFYAFYAMLLKNETFFQLNRLYIMASVTLSFIIPLIQAGWVQSLFITQQVKYVIYTSPVAIIHFDKAHETQINIGQLAMIVYFTVAVALLARLIWQLFNLKYIIGQQPVGAYSFFNQIRLSEDLKNSNVIEAHERVHARQWHSADVLLIELIAIINWFNPAVYLYRLSIKRLHEFIADRDVINCETKKSDYALLLLSQTFKTPTHNLVNPFFNNSLIKQRIMMMQKSKSNRIALIKYGFSVPLFMLMLVLSSATISDSKAIEEINKKAEEAFLTPARPAIQDKVEVIRGDQSAFVITTKNPKSVTPFKSQNAIKTDTVPNKGTGAVFTSVEEVPSFPGGLDAFYAFLGRNILYPAAMREHNVQGKVIASFIVEKDGSLSNIEVVKSPGYGSAEEASRVIALSPKWIPGRQNGKTVRTQYTVPIAFTLVGSSNTDTAKRLTTLALSTHHHSVHLSNAVITIDTGKAQTGNLNQGIANEANQPLFIVDGKK